MAKRDGRFLADFAFFQNYEPDLPPFVYFLAGVCRAESDSLLSEIVHTLEMVHVAAVQGRISASHRKLMFSKVYRGQDGDVKAMISKLPDDLRWQPMEDKRRNGEQRECKVCMGDETLLSL